MQGRIEQLQARIEALELSLLTVTPYATELIDYVKGNTPEGTDCEKWLDENIRPGWRQRVNHPSDTLGSSR